MEILTLGEKIKLKRKEMNMTLKDLAENRITPGQISLVESGKSKPSIDLLKYLAEKLDTDIEYFLESEEKQAGRICEFYGNIAESAISGGNAERANEAIEKGMLYAQKYKLAFFKGKFNYDLANLKLFEEKYEEAQQYCLYANGVFLKIQSVEEIVKSFILLGIITYKMDYVSTALNYFIQADNILGEYNHVNEFLKAQIFFYTAMCHNKNGNHSQAVDYALLAKDRLKVINNKREYAETLMILSVSYGKENNVNEALKYAREAKKIYNEINDIKEISDIETNLGLIFAKDDNMDESFAHLNKALEMKQRINDETTVDTMLKICDNYIKINELDKAIDIVDDAMNMLKDEQHLYRIKCMEYMFKIFYKKGDKRKAEEILLNGIIYMEPLGLKKELADFYIILGKFYTEIEEKELALNNINKGIDLYRDLGIISE